MSEIEFEAPALVVRCSECGEWHYADQVSVENIEEDFQGRDVVTFQCPEVGGITQSLVYNGFPRG